MSEGHSNIERIADAAEHVSDTVGEVGLLPLKNSRLLGHLITIVSVLCGITGSYVANRADTAYRLAEIAKDVSGNEVRITALVLELKAQREIILDMELHGHADHERRLQKMENQAADRTQVHEVEHQVSLLAEKIDKDHDILIRVVALMEQKSKEK